MNTTKIVAVIEPLTFSLDKSLSWAITSTLRAKSTYTLVDGNATTIAELLGWIPILQPIRATLGGTAAFVLVMRSVFDAATAWRINADTGYSLKDKTGTAVGTVLAASMEDTPFSPMVILSPSLSSAGSSNIESVQAYVADLATQHWRAEPIAWTTHALQLASNGRFLSAHEIHAAGLSTGVLAIKGIATTIVPGPKPIAIPYRTWKGAGVVKRPTVGGGSSSCNCTFGGGSSTGGDFGTGASNIDGGGYTGGGIDYGGGNGGSLGGPGGSVGGGGSGGGGSGGGGSGGGSGGGGCEVITNGKATPKC